MARSITLVVKLVDRNHAAGVEMNTGSSGWKKTEPGGSNKVFKTTSGSFRTIGTQTELLRPGGGLRVGRLENFDAGSVKNGASGQGLSDEAGTAVTLES